MATVTQGWGPTGSGATACQRISRFHEPTRSSENACCGILARRWEVAVTTVVAAGGFGKTTALAQAVRANLRSERGVDFYVCARPFDRDSDQFANLLLTALGREPVRSIRDPERLADLVAATLGARSPSSVCLLIDEIDRLGSSSGSVDVLRALVRVLPGNAHLVLSGRELPQLPLRGIGQRIRSSRSALTTCASGTTRSRFSPVLTVPISTSRAPAAGLRWSV